MTDFAPTDYSGVFPRWVPQSAQHYVFHTENGRSIRSLAKFAGCHASTVLRQVRRLEARRDDLLVDEALVRLAAHRTAPRTPPHSPTKDGRSMTRQSRFLTTAPDDTTVEREARRILRRLCEPHACLAVAKDMEKSVVVREGEAGRTTRTAVVDRPIVQAMALKDWISCENPGRISRYRITGAGRSALKLLLAEDEAARVGMSEAQVQFFGQDESDTSADVAVAAQARVKTNQYSCAESPVAALARRKDKNGEAFIAPDLCPLQSDCARISRLPRWACPLGKTGVSF